MPPLLNLFTVMALALHIVFTYFIPVPPATVSKAAAWFIALIVVIVIVVLYFLFPAMFTLHIHAG
jgi:hypothetical protein